MGIASRDLGSFLSLLFQDLESHGRERRAHDFRLADLKIQYFGELNNTTPIRERSSETFYHQSKHSFDNQLFIKSLIEADQTFNKFHTNISFAQSIFRNSHYFRGFVENDITYVLF